MRFWFDLLLFHESMHDLSLMIPEKVMPAIEEQMEMVCYITAAACSVLVLFLCPKRKRTWTQCGGNTLMPYLLHPVFTSCLWFIPYAPRFAVPVSFALALITLFSIHLCFKWRGRLFLYTDRRSRPPFHNGGLEAAWIVNCKRS